MIQTGEGDVFYLMSSKTGLKGMLEIRSCPRKYQTLSALSLTYMDRHPGKGDPFFRIARKPGPSVIMDMLKMQAFT
ncbi:hypothetical protein [Desulfatibacillum aliphaticivorans]|uniref:hypothetical protein n=1 Tax=Desulfatibacillum aliphaticivorans TaxID=218208 RepID=UPI000426CE9D|nr:hypothetical protein [Desulfatibacillum aliphaticivorans]